MATVPELTDDQWAELVERLTRYADCKLAKHTWRGLRLRQGGSVPGGRVAADIAQQAITDVLDDRRTWNPTKEPEFLAFLEGVVDSLVSHLVNRKENRKDRRMAEPSEDGGPGQDFVFGEGLSTLELVVNEEGAKAFRDAVMKELHGDPLAQAIFDCVEAGYDKAADIAETSGKPVEEIYNATKRFRAKVEKARSKMETGDRHERVRTSR